MQAADHSCLESLTYHSNDWIEEHGEPCSEEWYSCDLCGEQYTPEEINAMEKADRESLAMVDHESRRRDAEGDAAVDYESQMWDAA